MGIIAYIRQIYLDADHYKLAKSIYEKHPQGLQRPAYDRTLEGVLASLTRIAAGYARGRNRKNGRVRKRNEDECGHLRRLWKPGAKPICFQAIQHHGAG